MKKLILLLCMVSNLGFSQVYVAKGRVLDKNNFPLPGANIEVKETGEVTVSDFDGYFTLLSSMEGLRSLTISYMGFENLDATLRFPQNEVANFTLNAEINQLSEVVVSSFQSGNVKALNKQRNDINITNIVSADQIGKFPDANIGDALKRISGVSMQNDQGEARDIIIRGFAPGLNAVTLNGDRIPSAEGDNRRIQMDLIPSDMIQTIEVNKTLTPDMEADAIGGSVNLITRSNPNSFRFSSTISAGTNPIRKGGYNRNLSLILADKLGRFNYTFSANHNTSDYGSDNIEFDWDKPGETIPFVEQDIRRYDVKRTRKSVSLNLDYFINPAHLLYIKSIYNSRDDWENRWRMRIAKISEDNVRVRKQTKGGIDNDENKGARLEDQKMYKIALGGEHQLGKLGVDWKYSFSKASEDRPNERYVRFEQKNVPISKIDTRNPRFPNIVFAGNNWNTPENFELDEVQEANKKTSEENNSFRVNFKFPYSQNDYLKFGYKRNGKSKMRDDIWYDQTDNVNASTLADAGNSDVSLSNYLPGTQYRHGLFATPKWLGSLDFSKNKGTLLLEEFAVGNYTADETINATYLMVVDQLGKSTKLILGGRFEATDISYAGYS